LVSPALAHIYSNGTVQFNIAASPPGSFVQFSSDELALFLDDGNPIPTLVGRKTANWRLDVNVLYGNADHTITAILQPGDYRARYIVTASSSNGGRAQFRGGSMDVEIIPIG
jgi:hypothetical protein